MTCACSAPSFTNAASFSSPTPSTAAPAFAPSHAAYGANFAFTAAQSSRESVSAFSTPSAGATAACANARNLPSQSGCTPCVSGSTGSGSFVTSGRSSGGVKNSSIFASTSCSAA